MSETARTSDHRLALPAGRALGEYRIERCLGAGPFGITYLAIDRQNRRVVIKEYLPADIVTRDGAVLRGETPGDDDLLRRGRDRFLSEGKRLQRVKHASVVRLLNAFEANHTGYLVFEHESGQALADVLTGAHALADEPLLRRFAFTMLEALEAVHEAAFLHGKVEQSNILLRSDGTPVLLDFGSARAATGLTRRASMALVPGYAAIEQYTAHEAQGPWTDLYGLAAVLYRVVSGKDPLDAPARLLEDRLVPATETGSGRFSKTFLRAIDTALVVRPEERPQTVAEWRPMLDKPLAPQAMAARDPENADDSIDDVDDYVPDYGARQERSRTWIYATAGIASIVVLGTLALAGIGYMSGGGDPRRMAASNPPADRLPVARDQSVMPLPPVEDAAAREARLREDERQVAAQIAAARAADEQRAREAARQREQARLEQERQAAAQQEQTRQQQARQEQARQEQERQAAAARAAEEARQREAAARQEAVRQEQARQEAARQEAARQEQAKQEAARQEAARQEQARQEQARQEQARAEQAKAEQAKAEQERQAAARAAQEAQQRAALQQQETERQAAATRVAEEIRQRELIRQQEQVVAARTLEEARAREQARAPAETPRTPTTSGSAMLLPPPPPPGGTAPVQLTGPVLAPPPAVTTLQQSPPPQQVARATAPPLVQPPAPRPEPVVATPAPAARAAVDVGRIDAVNWQWGYVVMHMDQRQSMQVGDRVFARVGDTKLWMTVRRVSGTQVSAVPDSDLQRYSVNGRVYKE